MECTNWERIDGWFNQIDASLYDMAVRKFPAGATFVEVGSYCGRSSLAMVEAIIRHDKKIEFFCVDQFSLGVQHPLNKEENSRALYIKNTRKYAGYIRTIPLSSHWAASRLFLNATIDFIYIDADHHYDAVKDDLKVWHDKVKKGGIISGHDWGIPDVRRAVSEFANLHSYEIKRDFIHASEPDHTVALKNNYGDSWYFYKN